MEKAALSLLVSTVSPFINSFIKFLGEKPASYFGGDVTPEEVRKLQKINLPTIQTVIKAAGAFPADELIKPWLMDLQAAVFEAEDVLDLCEYKNIKNKVSGPPESLNKLIAKTKEASACMLPKTSLKKSIEKLQESADNAKELLELIRYALPQDTKRQQSTAAAVTVSDPSSPAFGRDEERDDLIDMLISEQDHESSSTSNITQHALYGLGGAGKTTLAQYVYNEERMKSHFETRMWIPVSRNFDVHRITREIIESAGQGREKCPNILNLDALQMKLEELLNSKKFLLVLDDVWCEDSGEWDKLLAPLIKAGHVGSRILITTRMQGVALILGVQSKNIRCLKDLRLDDCWSILKHYAFRNTNEAIEDQDLAATGRKIVDKLKNSPLAARLVGSLLRRNVDAGAWEMILQKGVLGGTLDSLLLSFRYLPLHLQSCFTFSSLYPKGYSFSKDKLACLWVAEGFVEAHMEEIAVEKGQQYFDELLSYSFFQPEPARSGRYIIHDLLHDLAEKVSEGHCFRIEGEPPANIPPTVVHLSVVGGLPMSSLDTLKLVNLHTFMHISSKGNTITEGMLEMLAKHRTLRVLHLQSSIDKLSSSMGKLKHLRYLKVSKVKELPESLGKLYHLQFLILKHHDIERAPKRLNNLVNLQHLISGPDKGIRVLEIGRLTLLQTLNFYYVERSKGYGIEQLKSLQQLRGSLAIEGLENVKNKTDAIEAGLNQKKHLEELILVWKSETNTYGRADEEILEGLKPPPNLKKLGIRGYMGANTSGWMLNNQYLRSLNLTWCPNLMGVAHGLPTSLVRLAVDGCAILPSLPENLEKLPSLEDLEIRGCLKMESLPNLPISLIRLAVSDCPIMESLPSLPTSLVLLVVDGCSILPSLPKNLEKLPSLKGLEIRGCPKMELLPNLPTSLVRLAIDGCAILPSLPKKLPSLKELEIRGCPKMESLPNLPTSLERLAISGCDIYSRDELSIRGCPMMESLPNLPTSLVRLVVDDCAILPSLPENLEKLPSLKELSIRGCPKMESMPNLPTSLLRLIVTGCSIVPSLPENLENLPSLEGLEIRECPKMESMPNLPTSLVRLVIDGCAILPSLPENLEKLPSLEGLEIRECPKMESLPSLPTSLVRLAVDGCAILPSLPENLEKLPSLKELEIRRCPKMESLPNLPTSLVRLTVDRCAILPSLPGNLKKLPSLEGLSICGCPIMESLPNLPTSLEQLDIRGCDILPSLPENLEKLSSLEELEVGGCPKMESLPNLPTSLVRLDIRGCDILPSLPENLEELSSLEELEIGGCPKMVSLSNLPTSLLRLVVWSCDILPSLPENIKKLPSLERLDISVCPKMESLPNLPTSLVRLVVSDCDILPSLPENLEEHSSLEELTIRGCSKIESLPNLPTSPSLPENLEEHSALEKLWIHGCSKMESLLNLPTSRSLLENLEEVSSLEKLWTYGCSKMESLLNLPTSMRRS